MGVGVAGQGAGGAGQVVREGGAEQPGAVRGEPPGRCTSGGVNQVGEHLLDERMGSVGQVGVDGPRVFRTAAWWLLCCLLPVQVLVVDLEWGLVAES